MYREYRTERISAKACLWEKLYFHTKIPDEFIFFITVPLFEKNLLLEHDNFLNCFYFSCSLKIEVAFIFRDV